MRMIISSSIMIIISSNSGIITGSRTPARRRTPATPATPRTRGERRRQHLKNIENSIFLKRLVFVSMLQDSGGGHLSNTTCPTQAFFKSGEECGTLRRSWMRRKTRKTNEAVLDKKRQTRTATQQIQLAARQVTPQKSDSDYSIVQYSIAQHSIILVMHIVHVVYYNIVYYSIALCMQGGCLA